MVSRDRCTFPTDVARQLSRLKVRPKSIAEGLAASVNSAHTFRQIDQDTIECGGVTMRKPFVEKPVSGEDHNVTVMNIVCSSRE